MSDRRLQDLIRFYSILNQLDLLHVASNREAFHSRPLLRRLQTPRAIPVPLRLNCAVLTAIDAICRVLTT